MENSINNVLKGTKNIPITENPDQYAYHQLTLHDNSSLGSTSQYLWRRNGVDAK